MKRMILVAVFLMLLVCTAVAQTVIPADEFPSINSEWNLTSQSMYFTDGQYFFVNGGNGRFYRLDPELQLGEEVFDKTVSGITQIHYDGETMYFCADRVKKDKGGLFCVKLVDGEIRGEIRKIIAGSVVSHFDISEDMIYYTLKGKAGIYRIPCEGGKKVKISSHEIRAKNPAGRLHVVDGYVYYINEKDHYLWRIPCDAEDTKSDECVIRKEMHSFILAPYQGKRIVVYVKYAKDTNSLDKSHVRVIDMDGNRVRELDHLRDIQSRYINYYGGYLYYIDFGQKVTKPYRVSLQDAGAMPEMIWIDAQHPFFDERLGYIHVFDGWAAFIGMTPTHRVTNPRTGRSDITNRSGDGIWFVNLETLETYKCWLPMN